ncbi:helix-turn-helix transcriptional regulator [Chryseobacterium indoltheticum]
MKLSTKDIARISFIETRTVQNKKYRIRKKLNIPQNADIYQWIDQM